ALRAMAHAYVRAGIDRPQMYALLYSTEGAMPEAEPRLLAAKVEALGVCRGVIEAAVADGQLDLATDPETSAHTFWVGAHGLVSLELGGFLVVGRSVDDLLDPLVTILIEGLKEVPA
ncbi:MAG: TetR-like C-terminal domain-containing protein, partial [Actinomycetota bacterium]